MSERLFAELRRHFYSTPSSYLDLLQLYMSLLDTKRHEIICGRDRISCGLEVTIIIYKCDINKSTQIATSHRDAN
ncbi:unnamed protein product [Parnassius apollo]|uniref:(apollo) hypothetical protein n=1 Tax=Parnassius apollo TaxID=110799 RepID=A0A8S3X839_PARAO|nr:unnamed protein product [Parnassius apollo]